MFEQSGMIDILQKAKSGDKQALASLYDSSYERVYRFVFYRALDTAITEDIVSDVWMKILQKIKSFRGETQAEWESWILRIAYNTFIDSYRKGEDVSLTDIEWEISTHENVAKTVADKLELERVVAFIANLSERDQRILTLRIWDDLSYDEISRLTGESLDNCKKIVSRSLAKITANFSFFITFSLVGLYVFFR